MAALAARHRGLAVAFVVVRWWTMALALALVQALES